MEPNQTMARHAATRDLLGAFALGAVDAEDAATVRAHLATCAECQAEMADRRSVPDAWSEVSGRIESNRVRTAVETLPGAQRRAIEMAFFDGLTHREIAERDGLPLGTVKGRLRLGLKRLSGLLAEPAPGVTGSAELNRGT